MSSSPQSLWVPKLTLPVSIPCTESSDVIIDLSHSSPDEYRTVDIHWLRSQLVSSSMAHLMLKKPALTVSLRVRNNNLRSRQGSSALGNLLYSLLWRRSSKATSVSVESYAADDEQQQQCPPHVHEIDLSGSGALDATDEWVKYFELSKSLVCADDGALRRVAADDEILQPRTCAPLLHALFSSPFLTHISLQRCLLEESNMRTIAAAVGSGGATCMLEHLNLDDNCVDAIGLEVLCRALSAPHQGQLRVLVLSNNKCACDGQPDKYSRKGLLALAELVLKAPRLTLVGLSGNGLGSAYANWPIGGDHGGVSEVCEAARRSMAAKDIAARRPPIVALMENFFDEKTKESLHRCSGFTALV